MKQFREYIKLLFAQLVFWVFTLFTGLSIALDIYEIEIPPILIDISKYLFPILGLIISTFNIYKKQDRVIKKAQINVPMLYLYLANNGEENTFRILPTPQEPNYEIILEVEKQDLYKNAPKIKFLQALYDTENYNEKCEEYIKEYEAYRKDLVQKERLEARMFSIDFELLNDGPIHAEDITIKIEFPSQLTIGNEETRDKWNYFSLYPIQPPKRPNIINSYMVESPFLSSFHGPEISPFYPPDNILLLGHISTIMKKTLLHTK